MADFVLMDGFYFETDVRLITFSFIFDSFFDVESRGIEAYTVGKGGESEEVRWELLETKEADGKTDPNRSENSFCVRSEADKSLGPH